MSNSTERRTIDCRKCGEQIPVDETACPHCGSRVITKTQSIVMIAVGLLLLPTLFVGLYPVAFLGLLVAVAGVAFYRNRQQKIEQATVSAE